MEQLKPGASKSTKRNAEIHKCQPLSKRPRVDCWPALVYAETSATADMDPCVKLPPHMVIPDKSCWDGISEKFEAFDISHTYGLSTRAGIIVQPNDFSTQKKLISLLNVEDVCYYFQHELRVMIRGLPLELNCESIFADLKSQKLPIREVHRICHPISGSPYKLVLIVLDESTKRKRVFKLNAVCGISDLQFEVPRNIGQCPRCDSKRYSDRIYQNSSREITKASQNTSIGFHEPVTTPQMTSTSLEAPEILLASSTDLQMLDIRPQTSTSMDCQKPEKCDPDKPSAMVCNTDEDTKIRSFLSHTILFLMNTMREYMGPKNFQEIQVLLEKLKANPKNRIAVLVHYRELIDRLHK